MFISFVLLMLLVACSVHGNVTSTCRRKEMCESYLDLAIDMIRTVKHNIPACPRIRIPSKLTFDDIQPGDCTDILQMGYDKSGTYKVWPMNRLTEGKAVTVYCDMDTDGGGWTVIQRRGDFGSPKDYFFRNWTSYKEGFGDVEKDFWLGNDNIFALTHQKLYSARFDLMDFKHKKKFALFNKFWIDDESYKYTLHISIYSGNAADRMTVLYNKNQFSTIDEENNSHGSAERYKGGWWYSGANLANLNGLYYKQEDGYNEDGMFWFSGGGSDHSWLEWTEIKVRPNNYNPSFESKIIPY